jgi:hypothetical protein
LHVLRTPQPQEQPTKTTHAIHLMWRDGSVLCGAHQPSRFWLYPWTENVWNWSEICADCKAAWKQLAMLAAAA